MRRLIIGCSCFLFALLTCIAYPIANKDFRVSSIKTNEDHPLIPLSYNEHEKEEIKKILNQPFTYLGKGSQCYAFISQDKHYVLKFFRHDRYRIPSYLLHLPYPNFLKKIQDERLEEKKIKLEKFLSSCLLAQTALKKETGLICLHFHSTPLAEKKISLKDRYLRTYKIEIDQYDFILQHKAEVVKTHLEKMLRKQDSEGIKASLTSLFSLIHTRFEKKIGDKDPALEKNAGFLPNHEAIFIDIGQFYIEEDSSKELSEKNKMLKNIRSLLLKHNEDLIDLLEI